MFGVTKYATYLNNKTTTKANIFS